MRDDRLLGEVERLGRKVESLASEVRRQKFDIPPDWVIRAAREACNHDGWDGAYAILCGYYGLPSMYARVNPEKVPQGAIACYYPNERTAYAKEKTVWVTTAMHEFAHHICSTLLRIGGEPEQAFCDAFALAIHAKWSAP